LVASARARPWRLLFVQKNWWEYSGLALAQYAVSGILLGYWWFGLGGAAAP